MAKTERSIFVNTEANIIKNKWIIVALGFGGLSFAFAYFSNDFVSVEGWLGFLASFLLLSAILWRVWKYFRQEQAPNYLLGLTILAVVIRLFLGLVWFLALPNFGYDNEMNQAGYVMGDAYNRDTAAWEFSQTNEPLLQAFQGYSHTDQYGGLLYFSSFVYRYLGTDIHQPLLMVVYSAFISSIAVFFVWGIAKHEFGNKVAKLSAWFLVLYPEAGLLGSSQMREAYSITLLVLIVFAFLNYYQKRKIKDLLILIAAFLITLLLSIPFAFSVLVFIGILLVWKTDWSWFKKRKHWLKTAATLIISIGIGWIFLVNFSEIYGVDYQEYQTIQASGKIAALFEKIPEWVHTPFLVIYGVVRPLLPAAIADMGNEVWGGIAIWRAVGWTLMLTALIYSTFLVVKEKVLGKMPGAILLYVWAGILFASYRSAGDQWDNPRYRVAFAGLQVIIVAWALVQQRETKDPWLRRGIGLVTSMIAWFIAWYINRNVYYFNFGAREISDVIGLGLACGGLYMIWDWLIIKSRGKNS